MKRSITYLALLSVGIITMAVSCQSKGETYGGSITMEQVTPLAALCEDPGAFSGQEVLVSAKVTDVCQDMGCWLSLQVDNGEDQIIRFKDHAFVVPKDLAGKTVRVQGVFSVEVDKSQVHEHEQGEVEKDHECPVGKFAFTASAVQVI